MAITVTCGAVAVLPTRVVSVVFPQAATDKSFAYSFVDRGAVRHVASGVTVDVAKQLLSLVLVLAGLGAIGGAATSDTAPEYAAVGAVLLIIAVLLWHFSQTGALALFDETGTSTKIPLKRRELSDGARFATEFGATLGR